MAKRRTQAQIQRDQRVRSVLKILKSKGLYKGDLRKPLTSYARKKARDERFADVVSGKATVVTAKSKTVASKYSGKYVTQGRKIIVPKAQGRARITRTGQLRVGGEPVTRISLGRRQKKGEVGRFVVRVKSLDGRTSSDVYRGESMGDAMAFIGEYDDNFDGYEVEIDFEPF